jgi:hypothetical protein
MAGPVCVRFANVVQGQGEPKPWTQRRIERELKGLVLLFTHWVQASGVSFAPSKPHEYWHWPDHTITYTDIKKEMWA